MNYLYAVLESEARLAASALGLDPGLGVLHADGPVRDSMACDLMEPVRPRIDELVLNWITRDTLSREWFFEQRDGNCRLMAALAVRLSETASMWGGMIAPVAEWVAQTLWNSAHKPTRSERNIPTRLTQRSRTEGRGKEFFFDLKPVPQRSNVCRDCGTTTKRGRCCPKCGREVSREKLIELAKMGRAVAQSPESQRKRAETQLRHEAAKRLWRYSAKSAWPDERTYIKSIQPALASVTISVIASKLAVSESYAADIRAGRRFPHPRHWRTLAELVGVWSESQNGGVKKLTISELPKMVDAPMPYGTMPNIKTDHPSNGGSYIEGETYTWADGSKAQIKNGVWVAVKVPNTVCSEK